jgi:hypothetical protein
MAFAAIQVFADKRVVPISRRQDLVGEKQSNNIR